MTRCQSLAPEVEVAQPVHGRQQDGDVLMAAS